VVRHIQTIWVTPVKCQVIVSSHTVYLVPRQQSGWEYYLKLVERSRSRISDLRGEAVKREDYLGTGSLLVPRYLGTVKEVDDIMGTSAQFVKGTSANIFVMGTVRQQISRNRQTYVVFKTAGRIFDNFPLLDRMMSQEGCIDN